MIFKKTLEIRQFSLALSKVLWYNLNTYQYVKNEQRKTKGNIDGKNHFSRKSKRWRR